MAELGSESRDEHQRIVEVLKSITYTQLILVGKNFGEFSNQLLCNHFQNSDDAALWMKAHQPSDSLILIKGSRSSKMEKLLESL